MRSKLRGTHLFHYAAACPRKTAVRSRPAAPHMKWKLVLLCVALAVVAGLVGTYFRATDKSLPVSTSVSQPDQLQTAKNPASTSLVAILAALPKTNLSAFSDPAIAARLSELLDEKLTLKQKAEAARALVHNGTDQAMNALKFALQNAPSRLQALIAEELGESSRPEATSILQEMIHGQDETAARGAIRGLALRNDAEAAQVLDEVLFDEAQPLSVRTEAALELGNVQLSEATSSLERAAAQIQDETMRENVLEGLGKKPFTETGEFFQNYLQTPGLSADAKVSALEALRNAEGDTAPLLLKYAADADADVRAAAAWALSSADTASDISPKLIELLNNEAEPEVRIRLYQAVANQETFDLTAVLDQARREKEPEVRLAALNAWAAGCRLASAPELAAQFDQSAVPELASLALNSESAQNRLSAVMCLQRAGTPGSISALESVAQSATDIRVVEASRRAHSTP